MDTIPELKEAIRTRNILGKYHLHRLGIFGSYARGQKANDLDVLVEDDLPYQQVLALRAELESVTGKIVDLVVMKHANPIILFRAQKDMVYVGEH
jgi:predicted nucleotidyltransferase